MTAEAVAEALAASLAAAQAAAEKVAAAHAVMMATIRTTAIMLTETGNRLKEANLEAQAAGLKTNMTADPASFAADHVEALIFNLSVKLTITMSPPPEIPPPPEIQQGH